jgi:hypothetical protein
MGEPCPSRIWTIWELRVCTLVRLAALFMRFLDASEGVKIGAKPARVF